MKLHIYSDLHVDSWRLFTVEDILRCFPMGLDSEAIAVFAGDAGNGEPHFENVITALEDIYDTVLSTKGNHDWYFESAPEKAPAEVETIQGVRFAMTPLFTNFWGSDSHRDSCAQHISDFRCIRGMTGEKMVELHNQSVEFLCRHLADVVITHWAPCLGSMHPKYAGHLANPYFVNDRSDLVNALKPQLWIHGHGHDSFNYMEGSTNIVSNPTGYAGENMRLPEFKPLEIEI